MHKSDIEFNEAYGISLNTTQIDRGPWNDYIFQDGLLFKDNRLCIPQCSMRENLIQEKHNGGLARHFGIEKTVGQLSHF